MALKGAWTHSQKTDWSKPIISNNGCIQRHHNYECPLMRQTTLETFAFKLCLWDLQRHFFSGHCFGHCSCPTTYVVEHLRQIPYLHISYTSTVEGKKACIAKCKHWNIWHQWVDLFYRAQLFNTATAKLGLSVLIQFHWLFQITSSRNPSPWAVRWYPMKTGWNSSILLTGISVNHNPTNLHWNGNPSLHWSI